jgi:hypothetical protein
MTFSTPKPYHIHPPCNWKGASLWTNYHPGHEKPSCECWMEWILDSRRRRETVSAGAYMTKACDRSF